jgi:hypothetical protein
VETNLSAFVILLMVAPNVSDQPRWAEERLRLLAHELYHVLKAFAIYLARLPSKIHVMGMRWMTMSSMTYP